MFSTNLSECCVLKFEMLGNMEPNILPLSSEGDGVLAFNGVEIYSNKASLNDCLAETQHFIRPFTVYGPLSRVATVMVCTGVRQLYT